MARSTSSVFASDGPEASFEEIFRSNDPVVLQLIVDLLDAHDLDVRSTGQLSGASVGVGQHLLANALRVPAAEADQARSLIRDFEASTPVVDDEDDEPLEEVPHPRRLIVAGLVPFVMPLLAGGLFYSRQTVGGVVLSLAEFAALFSGRGLGVWGTLKVAEVILSLRAARAYNRGERPTGLRQVGAVVLAIALALGLGSLLSNDPHHPMGTRPRFASPLR